MGRIAELVSSNLHVAQDAPISTAARMFERHPEADSLAVLGGARVRLLSRTRFFLQLGRRFGYSLFENRPVDLLAEDGSTVEAEAEPLEVITLATQREPARVYDDILVLERGGYLGTVSMRSLLAHHKELLVASLGERDALEARHRELQELHRLQSEFLANVTHELRTPLNLMLGIGRVMMGDPELPRSQLKNLERLLARGQELLALVNNVLEVSRLEGGMVQVMPEALHLGPFLEDVVRSMEPLLLGKPLALCTRLGPPGPAFGTDPVLLRRVLTNLLANAVKFTDAGQITLEAERHGGSLTLAVSDTGLGIAEEDLPRLFARFTQLDSTRRKRHAGAGLGLAIVKGLVEALGGTVSVQSRPGHGSTFTVRLPELEVLTGRHSA
ncbi:MAG TPA: ATP-binding protein [Vicinamibacteria bacterium]